MASVTTLVVALVAQAVAQTEAIRIERVHGEISVDGKIVEDAWTRVAPLRVETLRGGVPSERTDFRIVYDDRSVWASGRMFDSAPHTIMLGSPLRDVDDPADFFNLVLDTFNDDESAVVFTSTPSGRRSDWAISNDGEGDDAINLGWNAQWEVASSIDSLGWSIELRIPLSSLRYQVTDGRVIMGMIMNRWIPRTRERIVYPALDPALALAAFRPSRAQDIILEGVHATRPLHLTPSIGARANSNAGTAPGWSLDVKAQPTSRVTADLVFHSDFSEAELDAIQVNLSRERISFPELRQFFQERQGIFDVQLSDRSKLFYSRRIGLSEEGVPSTLQAGGRVYGRAGDLDYGALATVSGPASDRECASLLRLRQGIGKLSFVGVTVLTGSCDQIHGDAGIDAIVRVIGDTFLSGALATALGSSTGGPGALRLLLERRSRIGPQFRFGVAALDAGYEPVLGLLDRPGTTRFNAKIGYAFPGKEASPIFARTLYVNAERGLLDADGRLDYDAIGLGFGLETKRGTVITALVSKRHEILSEPLSLPGDRFIAAGNYTPAFATVRWSSPPNSRIFGNVTGTAGQFYDGRQRSASTDLVMSFTPRLNVGTGYTYNWITHPDMRPLDAHVLFARPSVAIGSSLQLTGLMQYDTDDGAVAGSVRTRWNLGEARDLWAIYNWANEQSAPATIARRGAEFKLRWMISR